MKPSTPESSSNIRGKFLDETLGTSILSLDGRMHMVNKSGPTASSLWFKNYDGSEANVIFPSGFSGSFLFPYAMGIGGVCGSNFVGTYFIENSSLISPTIISLLGMTLSINTNANKQYFINSSGYLDKTVNTQLTKTHNYNSTTGNWDVRGIQLEPRSCNVLNTDTPVFGATGATLGIATDFAAGYWNSTTIPNGMTVWKLVEEGNALPENTCWFSNQSITLLGNTLPTQSVGASPDGISFSAFMVSGFFTGPNKSVSGITKDIIQIWLATSPSGLVKKSVYFDLNTCSVASVSAGGITNAYFSTERYANGWCRCFAGVIYTGATYPADAAYGFS
ncbi:MAG: hypothetical protein EBS07_12895, partial [Sphingobacteriia bacterium]|nr:hypothetical protein [Sphingobacteriia bacterium]